MDLSSVPSWKKALESASCQMYFIPRDSYELEEKSLTVILYFKITRLSFALTTGVTYFLWGHSFWTYLARRLKNRSIRSFFLPLKKKTLSACILKMILYKRLSFWKWKYLQCNQFRVSWVSLNSQPPLLKSLRQSTIMKIDDSQVSVRPS
jgi:hypothetical protein